MKSNRIFQYISALLLFVLFCSAAVQAQSTAFTYQGRLSDSSIPDGNGSYTMKFRLYDAMENGNQIGSEQTSLVTVTNRIFTALLQFTANPFLDGQDRFLEVQIGNTTLSPRIPLAGVPYATRSINAGSADSLSTVCNPCVTNSQIVSLDGSKVTGIVSNATNAATANTATTAGNVTGVIGIANGGTGSSTKNFVDLSTNQTNIGGNKTFTGLMIVQNAGANSDVITGHNTAAAGNGVGAGVFGSTNQTGAGSAGVWGQNNNSNGTGIVAAGNNQSGNTLVAGSGLAATGFSTGVYARTTSAGTSQAIYTDNFNTIVRVNYYNGTQYKIQGAGVVSTLVRDAEKKQRVMFAPEAPEVLFEDYGVGQLVDGRASIVLDPLFAGSITVNDKHPLRVFIQLEGDCNGVYVTNKTAAGFEVVELAQGKSNVKFSWHVVGNRADEELGGVLQADGLVTPSRISRYTDLRFPVQTDDTPSLSATPNVRSTKSRNK
ncbi:MAG: hypothetical protein M3209_09085 [Acidobacteriota bacterium]|nr:hypothetical protein [Acidobacteriota bacterium]